MDTKEKERRRDISLDVLKTLLVLGMIGGHIAELLMRPQEHPIVTFIAECLGVITFSSFLYVFGATTQIAYMDKPFKSVAPKLIKAILKLYVGYLICGIGFETFVIRRFTLSELPRIMCLSLIPEYSEFLLSFFVILVLVLLFFKPLHYIRDNKYLFLSVVVLSLATTFIPPESVKVMQLGLFVGCKLFYCFPVLCYLSFFLMGMWVKRYGTNIVFWIVCIIFTIGGLAYSIYIGGLPQRFPPVLAFIVLPAVVVPAYHVLAKFIAAHCGKLMEKIFTFWGANTLDYLVVSNYVIFILRYLNGKDNSLSAAVVYYLAVVAICIAWGLFKRALKNISRQVSTLK